MIDGEKLLIGGNSAYLWTGVQLKKLSKYLDSKGDVFVYKGTKRVVTNPEAKFINAFTILLQFTVDNSSKYQIILQNNFVERFKEDRELEKFTLDEKYAVIRENIKLWFKKELET